MNRWLCIAYAFPPIARSGTFRTLGFVRHLDRLGWEATVLTVEPQGEPLDPLLEPWLPKSTEVIRTPWVDWIDWAKNFLQFGNRRKSTDSLTDHAGPSGTDERNGSIGGWKDWLTHLLKTPDSRTGWILPALRKAHRAVRGKRPRVIYSTSPYMSAHLIAAALQCLTRIPWVADFRDPWRGGPFRQIRYAGLDRWDAWLERHVFRKAARIVFASPTMTEDACRRYPFLKTKATTIINGFDGEMIEPATHKQNSSTEAFVLAHAGEFYGPRTPLPWFAALRRAVAASEDSRRAPRLLLIGPESYRGRALREIGNEAGVGEHVNVLGRLGRAESLRILAESDALVLAGSVGAGAELQIPNKLFEYLALRRPILANLPKKHPATDILRNARADAVVCEPDDEAAMAEGMLRIADRTREAPADAWSGVELFDRRHRAAQLVEVFESAGNGYGAKSSVRVNPSGTDH